MNTTGHATARSAATPPTRSVAAVPSRNIPPERTDAPSGSGAASMVAIKNEYDADTDDEAVLPASYKNSVSNDAASMVSIKKEYDAYTDDEEGNVANKNSVSNDVASMVAVNNQDQERKEKENFLMFTRVLMK